MLIIKVKIIIIMMILLVLLLEVILMIDDDDDDDNNNIINNNSNKIRTTTFNIFHKACITRKNAVIILTIEMFIITVQGRGCIMCPLFVLSSGISV